MTNKTSVSIIRKNFGKKNDVFLFLMLILVFSLGVMGTILNWRQGIASAGIITLVYLLQKIFKTKWEILAVIALLSIISMAYIFDFSFIEVLLTTAGFSFVFFLKSSYQEMKTKESFELFYLDKKKLKCLSTNHDADYKGYALNPRGFLKTYNTEFIKSFHFKGNHLLISIGNEIIRPRELNPNELEEIKEFISINFPHLLENEEFYRDNLNAESRFYLHKLIIFSPILILGLVIYFFADNGRNEPITYLCLGLMVLLPFILFKILKKN